MASAPAAAVANILSSRGCNMQGGSTATDGSCKITVSGESILASFRNDEMVTKVQSTKVTTLPAMQFRRQIRQFCARIWRELRFHRIGSLMLEKIPKSGIWESQIYQQILNLIFEAKVQLFLGHHIIDQKIWITPFWIPQRQTNLDPRIQSRASTNLLPSALRREAGNCWGMAMNRQQQQRAEQTAERSKNPRCAVTLPGKGEREKWPRKIEPRGERVDFGKKIVRWACWQNPLLLCT